jgi:hypothetical protein
MPNAKAMLYDTPKASFTHKDLRALRSCFCLAKKMAQRMGKGSILFGTLPAKQI